MKRYVIPVSIILAAVVMISIVAGPVFAATSSGTSSAPAGTSSAASISTPSSATDTSAAAGPLKIIKTINLGAGDNSWDYLAIDSKLRRLYISHYNAVEVVDVNTGLLYGRIADIQGVHGIAIVPESGELYTTNGRENKLGVFNINTLKPIRKLNAGQNPDSILYDPVVKKVFAFNNRSGDVTIVDITEPNKTPVTLSVGGALEAGVSDGAGRIYVNVEDKNEIAVIDGRKNQVMDHWPLSPGQGPTGLAIDRVHRRLFAGCDKLMVIVDANNGKVLGTAPTGRGVDGVIYDAKFGLAISANGSDGTMTVVREEPAGTFKVIQTLTTVRGARTITSDPVSQLMYLPCNAMVNRQKQFQILVVGSAKP
jgi:DNA-binding beta-propeller fold protein YncE